MPVETIQMRMPWGVQSKVTSPSSAASGLHQNGQALKTVVPFDPQEAGKT